MYAPKKIVEIPAWQHFYHIHKSIACEAGVSCPYPTAIVTIVAWCSVHAYNTQTYFNKKRNVSFYYSIGLLVHNGPAIIACH